MLRVSGFFKLVTHLLLSSAHKTSSLKHYGESEHHVAIKPGQTACMQSMRLLRFHSCVLECRNAKHVSQNGIIPFFSQYSSMKKQQTLCFEHRQCGTGFTLIP